MSKIPERFDVVGSVSSAGEVRQVELDLVPSLVKSHGHRADERLHSGGALIVRSSEPSPDVLVVKHLHFESKVFFKLNPINWGGGLHSL